MTPPRSLWDDTPATARELLPMHVREHLKRARYGRRVWVRKPGWIDFRMVRSGFWGLVELGRSRNEAYARTAEAFGISERYVRLIVRRGD